MKQLTMTVLTLLFFLIGGLMPRAEADVPNLSSKDTPIRVVIHPFEIHSARDLHHLAEAIPGMLATRIAVKDRIQTFVLSSPADQSPPSSDTLDAQKKEGHALDAEVIITGSITEFAGAFSLDTRVFQGGVHQPATAFFAQADSVENIIPAMNTVAARINQDLFNRTPPALIQPEALTPAASPENTLRRNPEKMLPTLSPTATTETNRPFWKFWDSNDPEPGYPDDTGSLPQADPRTTAPDDLLPDTRQTADDDTASVPFWKFWAKDKNNGPTTASGSGTLLDESMEEALDREQMEEDFSGDGEDQPFWKFW